MPKGFFNVSYSPPVRELYISTIKPLVVVPNAEVSKEDNKALYQIFKIADYIKAIENNPLDSEEYKKTIAAINEEVMLISTDSTTNEKQRVERSKYISIGYSVFQNNTESNSTRTYRFYIAYQGVLKFILQITIDGTTFSEHTPKIASGSIPTNVKTIL